MFSVDTEPLALRSMMFCCVVACGSYHERSSQSTYWPPPIEFTIMMKVASLPSHAKSCSQCCTKSCTRLEPSRCPYITTQTSISEPLSLFSKKIHSPSPSCPDHSHLSYTSDCYRYPKHRPHTETALAEHQCCRPSPKEPWRRP